jgi:hypothetical protein
VVRLELDEPKGAGVLDAAANLTLSEALASAFEGTEGNARITWNGVQFLLPYDDDAAEISSALIFVLDRIASSTSGALDVSLGSSAFPLRLDAKWEEGCLDVIASPAFDAEVKAAMRGRELIRSSCADFCGAWLPLLRLWESRLSSLGYRAEDVPEMRTLNDLVARLPLFDGAAAADSS